MKTRIPKRIAVKLGGRTVNLNTRKVTEAFNKSEDPEETLESYRQTCGRIFYSGLSWIERRRFGSLAEFVSKTSDEEMQTALNTTSRAVKSGSIPFVSAQ